MKIAETAIRQPIFATMVILALVVFMRLNFNTISFA